MPWLPVISVVAILDAALIGGIAIASFVRSRTTVADRLHRRRLARARVESAAATNDVVLALTGAREGGNEARLIETLDAVARSPSKYTGALVLLLNLVREGNARVRLFASWTAVRVLMCCPQALGMVQRDASPDVRLIAVRAAGVLADRQRRPPTEACQVIGHAMNDPVPAVRCAAATILVRLAAGQTFRGELTDGFRDSSPEVRAASATAIGAGASTFDVEAICRLLIQADSKTADALLSALSWPDRTIWPEMTAIAMNPASPARRAAIRLLGTDRHPGAQGVLATLLADRDRTIRLEAATAAAWLARAIYPERLESRLVEQLLASLAEESHTSVALKAIEALSCCGDARVPAALVERIPISNGIVRERLIEGAALFGYLARWSGGRGHAAVRT